MVSLVSVVDLDVEYHELAGRNISTSMAIESDQLQIQPLPIHKRQGMLPGPGAPLQFKIWTFPVT
jgi:hypothetical protein